MKKFLQSSCLFSTKFCQFFCSLNFFPLIQPCWEKSIFVVSIKTCEQSKLKNLQASSVNHFKKGRSLTYAVTSTYTHSDEREREKKERNKRKTEIIYNYTEINQNDIEKFQALVEAPVSRLLKFFFGKQVLISRTLELYKNI